MSKLAKLLQSVEKVGARNSKGGQDTELAHINPKESRLLKLLGGSGRVDPQTGLRHYEGDGDEGGSEGGYDGGTWGGAEDGPGAEADTSENGGMGPGSPGGPGNPGDNVENDAPGRGLGMEDAVLGDPTENVDEGLSGGNGSGSGGMAGQNDGLSDEGLGSSDGTNGPGLGTWDWSIGLTPEQQAQHEANVTNSINSALGYDTGASFNGNGGLGNNISNYLGLGVAAGVPGQATNSVAGGRTTATEDALPNEDAMSGGMSAAGTHSSFSTGTAGQAGNAVASNNAGPGGRGDTFDNVTNAYDNNSFGWNAENNQGGGWNGYANQGLEEAKGWINEHPGLTSAINMGLTAINPIAGMLSNTLTSAARGNYTPGLGALGSLLGGPQVGMGVSALSNLVNGTPGNTVAGMGANYLNSVAPGLGEALNATGLTGYAANGINSGFQSAMNNAMTADPSGGLTNENYTTDVNSDSAPTIDNTAPMRLAYATQESAPQSDFVPESASFSAPTYTAFGGGGSDGSSANEFLGSKKKTRYLQNSLMAMLGGSNAA